MGILISNFNEGVIIHTLHNKNVLFSKNQMPLQCPEFIGQRGARLG